MEGIYLIKKISVSDGFIDAEVEAYSTELKRDEAFKELVKTHNQMIIDSYSIDITNPGLSDVFGFDCPEYYYEFNDDFLEFLTREDQLMHHDIFEKGYVEVQ